MRTNTEGDRGGCFGGIVTYITMRTAMGKVVLGYFLIYPLMNHCPFLSQPLYVLVVFGISACVSVTLFVCAAVFCTDACHPHPLRPREHVSPSHANVLWWQHVWASVRPVLLPTATQRPVAIGWTFVGRGARQRRRNLGKGEGETRNMHG